ncbi:hypothetical protein COOONC_07445 [Cooperia oncophora]
MSTGDELDDRPPPTVIHVAPFREDSPEFSAFGTHAQRAAVISAGVGMSLVIFLFLSVFFEFDWYHHEKGIDLGALSEFLACVRRSTAVPHWRHVDSLVRCSWNKRWPTSLSCPIRYRLHGGTSYLKHSSSSYRLLNHIVVLSYLKTVPPQTSSGYVIVTAMFVFAMGVQGVMLTAVVRCRNYLEKRQIHDLEMRVAEKSKLQHPGIIIVFGAGDPAPNNNSSSGANPPNSTDAPPSYDNATQAANGTAHSATQPAPQRTVLQAQDGIV